MKENCMGRSNMEMKLIRKSEGDIFPPNIITHREVGL